MQKYHYSTLEEECANHYPTLLRVYIYKCFKCKMVRDGYKAAERCEKHISPLFRSGSKGTSRGLIHFVWN